LPLLKKLPGMIQTSLPHYSSMTSKQNPTAEGGLSQNEGMNEETNTPRLPEPESNPKVVAETEEPIQNPEIEDAKTEEAPEVIEEVEASVEEAPEVIEEVEASVEEAPEVIEEVEASVEEAPEVIEEVEASVEEAPEVIEEVEASVEEAPEVIEEVEASVEEAPEVIEEVEVSVAETLSPTEVGVEEHSLVEEVLAVHVDEDEEAEVHEEAETLPEYNTFSKEKLVEAIEELVRHDEITSVKRNIGLLRIAYHELIRSEHEKQVTSNIEEAEGTPQSAGEDHLHIRFEAAFGIYKEKKHKQDEEMELQKQRNLEAKNAILEELRVLISSEESLKKTYDEFRELQQKWKEIGVVPRNEVANLWQNYHFLVEKFFDKVRINKELRDLDLKKNLEEKIALCEKAEELLIDTSITRSFKLLQQYHTQWKEIGPVTQESRDEIWERFKSASEKINKRRRDFYLETKEEQETNLSARLALCDKIDDLLLQENKSIKDWNVRTDEVSEFFKLWKSIGPGPKKENDAAWDRFKASIDRFYAEKSEYFGKIKEEQLENYNRKVDICVQAEALKDSTDWKGTSNTLIRLQQEWKSIGPVSRKNADKIWKRFRTACDDFFQKKNDFFSNAKQHEQENLTRKQELIQRVTDFAFGLNKSENLKVLKDFQREWIEIGHVPMKEKDALQASFRKVIDQRMEELQISSSEIAELNYRSRLEKIMDGPDSSRILSKERMHMQNKITALQNEVNLWENNLGFLAASKNADLLKAEFETKIRKAKEEVALMKAQLKMLK
jgi:hypothetical protein